MKVDKDLAERALLNYFRASVEFHITRSFLHEMGITTKQWCRFVKTGKLHVRPLAAAKIRVEALEPNNPHRHALRKVIEIQHGAKQSPGD